MNIPGYKIEKELRQGPITTVYLGRQISLDRAVLVKVLNSRWLTEEDLVKRFHREAQICAQLKHRNIVDIIDIGTDPDNTYLIMDYVDGMDLEAFIKQNHPIPAGLVVFITHEILQGLQYAHSKGVVHRDIKPANILIDKEGRVKIADFGLARADHLPDISMHGEIIGSPAYLSPEQAQAKKPDHRSDLFSLGITISELAGRPSPFQADNLVATVQKLMSLTPPPLKEFRNDIPDWLSRLVSQLLNRKPSQRPSSTSEILALPGFQNQIIGEGDLQRFLSSPNAISSEAPEESFAVPESNSKAPHIMATLFGGLIILLTILSLIPDKYVRDVNPPQAVATEAANETTSNSNVLNEGQPTLAADSLVVQEDLIDSTGMEPQRDENGTTPIVPLSSNTRTERASGANNEVGDGKTIEKAGQTLAAEQNNGSPEAVITKPGHLMVTVQPWAEIFVNGERIDMTPLSAPLELQPGSYQLSFRNPDYETLYRKVDIASGELDTLHVYFMPEKGYLSVQVHPWADIFVDGKLVGQTPLNNPLELKPGEYELRLVNPLYKVWEEKVNILRGENVIKKVRLESRQN